MFIYAFDRFSAPVVVRATGEGVSQLPEIPATVMPDVHMQDEAELESFNRIQRLIKRSIANLNKAIAEKSTLQVQREKELLATYQEDLELMNTSTFNDELLAAYKSLKETCTLQITIAENLLSFAGITSQSTAASDIHEHDVVKVQWKAHPFNGDARKWLDFWPMFKLAIHDCKRYATETKLKCLNDCLRGDARQMFSSIQAIPENYEKIIQMLIDKYNEPNALNTIYCNELEKTPKATDEKSCQSTYLQIKSHVANLNALKDRTKVDTHHVRQLIMNKFPRDIIKDTVLSIYKETKSFNFDVDQLLNELQAHVSVENFLHLQLDAPEQTETTVLAIASNPKIESRKRTHDETTPKTTKEVTCLFCSKSHRSNDCAIYPTAASRTRRLGDLNRCFNCSGPRHDASKCHNKKAVCWLCGGDHMGILCPKPAPRPSTSKSNLQKSSQKGKSEIAILLQTFTCYVSNAACPGEKVSARGIFDSGSQSSFISQDLITQLDIVPNKHVILKCSRFQEKSASDQNSSEVTVTLSNIYDPTINYIIKLYTIPFIVNQPVIKTNFKNQLPTNYIYADSKLFSKSKPEIKILIGTDNYFNLIDVNSSFILKKGVALLNSTFGWIPTGRLSSEIKATLPTSTIVEGACLATSVIELSDLTRLWDLESLGIESPESHNTIDQVMNHFKESTYIDHDGRYVVRFPWKSCRIRLETNFRVAMARLKSLLHTSTPETIEKISAYFKDQLDQGIIEIAPPPKLNVIPNSQNQNLTHYLPFKGIFQKNKLRVVHDASAKTKSGISLNDVIHAGPKLIENSIILLINFRLRAIALSADIEKAFLQMTLNENDRDATRFIWVKDPNEPLSVSNLIYLRFARVPFGVNASPYLLNIVIRDILSKPPINTLSKSIIHKFYVDNFIHSVGTPTEAVAVYNTVMNRLSGAKFNLRDWTTNDQTVLSALPEKSRKIWQDDTDQTISILGLLWSVNTDYLYCQINSNLPNLCTKHNLLRYLASIYDPMGLWSPCIVELKVLVQNCWRNKFQWHEELPIQFKNLWLRLRCELENIPTLPIPRKLWPKSINGEYTLHIFCDASIKAYACCAYLVIYDSEHLETASSLIYSKSRLAPKNLSEKAQLEKSKQNLIKITESLSIPRLELMATVIGKRCAEFLVSNLELPIKQTILWTDATTVLQWLKTHEVLQPFIQNRITELRKAQNISMRYVPTNENPADYASRGKSPITLHNNTLWWKGPSWLGYPSLWPLPPPNVESYEVSSSILDITTLAINSQPIVPWLDDGLEKKFSSWDKLVNVYLYRLKFIYHKTGRQFPTSSMEQKILAERLLIVDIQQKYLFKEIAILKKAQKPLTNLDLFLDENNLVRCQGRLGHSKFPWETKHPILLPNKSFAVNLYILKVHKENHHVGVSHTLATLRERFWVVKGRASVKYVLHRCTDCRRWMGGSYKLPPMPPLPEIRLNALAAFVHVGADYFGPLRCLDSYKKPIDVHVLLFTCLVSRAIHLELVPDLSGKQCYLALQRFSALRRVPQIIITDNATTFTFVQPLVGNKVKITDFKINKFIDNNKIAWHFIPQYAPWYGGAYERLNALVKNSLKRTYGRILLDYDELRTALTLVADVTNSRPLTYVSSDEPIQILTPNHFIKLGPTNINVDIGEPLPQPKQTETGKDLARNYETISRVLDGYWDAFKNLYLLSLREAHRSEHRTKKGQSQFSPSVGDVVLVKEPSLPRANWSFGRVEKLDHRQALAHVRCKGQILLRSILHLYPLEVVKPINTQPTHKTNDQPSTSK